MKNVISKELIERLMPYGAKKALAHAIGVPQSQVSQWSCKRVGIAIRHHAKIRAFLGVKFVTVECESVCATERMSHGTE